MTDENNSAETICIFCPFTWVDNRGYRRCSENSTARFYFRCPVLPYTPLVAANIVIPKLEREGRYWSGKPELRNTSDNSSDLGSDNGEQYE